jgi:hypothetical protein
MGKLLSMAKPTRRNSDGKLQTDSYPELKICLEAYAPNVRGLKGVKEKGERFQLGHLIEAVLAWFAVQPDVDRELIVQQGREVTRILEQNAGMKLEMIQQMWARTKRKSGNARSASSTPGPTEHLLDQVGSVVGRRHVERPKKEDD